MNKFFKKIALAILALGAVFIIGTVSINSILKSKLENFIQERLPENMVRSYDNITVESLGGSLIVKNASLIIKNKEDNVKHTFINVEKLKISDISYWDYIFNGKIHAEAISLENPKIVYYQDRLKPSKDSTRQAVAKIYKPIIVDHVEIKNTKFAIYEKGGDSTKIYTSGLTVKVDGVKVDNKTVIRKIPFEYNDFKAQSDTVFVKVSPYENLTVESFSLEKHNALFKNLKLKTKYSKRELSQIIKKERDYYALTLKSLLVADFDFGFENNRFFAKSKKISLEAPALEVYRDKLVADDPKTKPLYSKMLRELPFDLTVDSLKIDDAKIKYEERQKQENMGGSIDFKNLNAAISNVSNTYTSPTKTEIKIDAIFMDKTPISANWSFDVQNTSDQFLFEAKIGSMVADRMNSFTEPNLKVRLEGTTNSTFFTIDGNSEASRIDMKIKYTDFKVVVLREDGKRKNRFLSAVANIFISKNSKKDNNNYRESQAKATRDKTKSVFNFLWLSVKNALMKAMLGNNKKG